MKKIYTFFLALAASAESIFAWDYETVKIGDLYYNLDSMNQIAEVTSQDIDPYWSTSLTIVSIPVSVTYNKVGYSVTSIGEWAFANCYSLTSVAIPNSVTNIEDNAFTRCRNLTSVEIPNSVTSIGVRAFEQCSNLNSVTIPNSVTSIGYGAFIDVFNIVYKGPATDSELWGAKSINGYVDGIFSYKDATKTHLLACNENTEGEIIIPNSVTSIEKNAFAYCGNLTSVKISNSVTSIGGYAFRNCRSLTSIKISSSVTSIGEGTFEECENLVHGSGACGDNLTWLYEDGVLTITGTGEMIDFTVKCNEEYSSCWSNYPWFPFYETIHTVKILQGVTSIGNNAFNECINLTSVEIPEGTTKIGESAFNNCQSLISVTLPNTIQNIGKYTFSNCYSLSSINLPKNIPHIENGTFSSCLSLKSITLPENIKFIGNDAFSYCINLNSIILPETILSIGNDAFDGCDNLQAIYIPAGLKLSEEETGLSSSVNLNVFVYYPKE